MTPFRHRGDHQIRTAYRIAPAKICGLVVW
jgi:hypothetical protein